MKLKFYSGLVIVGSFLLAFQLMEKNKVIKKVNPIEVNSNTSLQTNSDLNFYLPTSSTSQIVKHAYYTLSYNEKAEQAEWVAYQLNKKYIIHNTFKRPYFIEDPKVNTKSADWKNYKKSGYDKGHLCPAADMKFDKKAFDDTFYTSNISPQKHEFNAGIWNRIEQKIRFWAVKNDGLIIITGGVLKGISKTIGTEKVVVPNYFYKIALSLSKGNYKVIAFLVPNEKSSKSIFDYVVAVDKIESITGIDFFPKLEDTLENSLEKKVDISSWLSK
ncbi:MAG: DNA/RNA non-specific endonuclease [Flavobacterium sp.]